MADATGEQWMVVKTIFAAALEQPDSDRPAFLAAECGGDSSLMSEVVSLLDAHEDVGDFLGGRARDRLRGQLSSSHHAGLEPGTMIGAYRIEREIARGGMGTVFLAERADAEYTQRVAIKLVTRGMDTELVVRRFRRERQILAELQHPNIARLLEGGTTRDGLPYFVMEYIEGEHIDRYCDARGLSIGARLDLFREVCAAVQYAHQRLVVHRDIKPANILVTPDGVPRLLDFGIARLLGPADDRPDLTAPHLRPMTPEYASPEQRDGRAVTTLADVYSRGGVLYRLLAGAPPHLSAGDVDPAAPSTVVPSLRGDLDTIVLTAMRREPERRYASAQALSDDIRRYRRSLPIAARADRWSYRALKFVRRNRLSVALGTVATVALVVGMAAVAWQGHVARVQRTLAEQQSAHVRRLALSLLFDVHDAIVGLPGSTRARGLILQRALQALESLDTLVADGGDDPLLRRDIAAAYLRVGEVQGAPYGANLGRTAAALVSYGRAVRLMSPALQASPRDTAARHVLANALFKSAAIRMRAGAFDAAEADARQAVAVVSRGLVLAPRDTIAQRYVLRALLYLGDVLAAGDDGRSLPRVEAARDAYTRALGVAQTMAARTTDSPGVDRSLGSIYTRLGYVGSWTGEITGDTAQLASAVAYHRDAERFRQRTFARDSSAESERGVADGWMDIANTEQPLGHFRVALALLDSAGPIFAALARADTSNVEARRDLAFYEENRSVVLLGLGRFTEAASEARMAIALLRRLQRDDQTSVEEYYHLSHAQGTLGDALALGGGNAAARAAFAEARTTVRQWRRAAPAAVQPARVERELVDRIGRLDRRHAGR